jgi:hypothetical protein
MLFLLGADHNPHQLKTAISAHFLPVRAPDCDPARALWGECAPYLELLARS